MRRSLRSLAVCVALLGAAGTPAGASTVPRAPHLLPGDAAAASVRAAPHAWLVGARPGAATARIAGRHGARRIGLGLYVAARSRARALVRELRIAGRYGFSEPDALARPRAIEDPLMLVGQNWRDYVANPDLVPPAVSPSSPLLAVIDSQVDPTPPEGQGGARPAAPPPPGPPVPRRP